jgi:putative endonuclease
VSKANLNLGRIGEVEAASFLKRNGYKVIGRNYKSKFGEIDIIAYDQDTLCFVEVKTRNTCRFGLPQEAVSISKQQQISKAALAYLKEHKLLDRRARFDVISVNYQGDYPSLSLLKDAFNLSPDFSY